MKTPRMECPLTVSPKAAAISIVSRPAQEIIDKFFLCHASSSPNRNGAKAHALCSEFGVDERQNKVRGKRPERNTFDQFPSCSRTNPVSEFLVALLLVFTVLRTQ